MEHVTSLRHPVPSVPRPILYLHSSAGRYGADRQLAAMVGGLDPARYRAIVVLAHDGPLVDDLAAAGAEVLVRPLSVLRRDLLSPAGLARVAAAWASDAGGLGHLARHRDVALVHTNSSVTLGGAAAARIARIPHVWHVRELYSGYERWWPTYRRMLLTADALPCVSEAVRGQFDDAPRANRSPRGSRTTVLPDGLPLAPDPIGRDAARRQLDLAPDAFVVALLGRLSSWKGQEILIDALAEPPLRDHADTVVLLAGSAWRHTPQMTDALRERAAARGVAERVRLSGFVDRVGLVYAAADLVAVPSTQPDPLPNAVLEAAAAGCCVVAADHSGLRELLDGGRLGVLVPPGDPVVLSRALSELHDDPARRARLGAAAAREARARFGPERLAERIDALYSRLLTPS